MFVHNTELVKVFMVATTHLINALVLVIFGLWGYIESGSPTAFIPVGFGLILSILYSGVKKESFVSSHIAVVLTILVLVALLIKPLPGALESGNTGRILRTIIMVVTSASATVGFVLSFVKARQKKKVT